MLCLETLFQGRGRAEELVARLFVRHTEDFEVALDRRHEAFRAEEVGVEVTLFGQPRRQLLLAQHPDFVRGRAHAIVFCVAIEALELRVLGRQGVDPVTERMHPAVSRAVDKVHRALGGQGCFEHRQRRCDAHPAADQHQRLVAGNQGEFARWREQVEGRADVHLVMQVVGHPPTGLALDADAVQTASLRADKE